ncbi:exonuclease domain-containing protein [Arcanobacterium phocae]|uniref:exonuclease domain-containing protein n=1 Tax=Arcanobacterium phocae TaxID=131112 RepID=UPI001C0F2454|nr:exonuclease domain-containing protein [Arcanobacterium phocae]
MHSFVAIDFETANEQRRSACMIGMARFDEEGAVTDTYEALIQPHPDVNYFNPINTWVHGITPEDVADAPQWDKLTETVTAFIGDAPIVAHNMAFDGSVLSDLAQLYGTPAVENYRFCTLRLARHILADRIERKTLDNVYDYYFPGESFVHHNAVADAQACGRIFARMQIENSYEKLKEQCPPTTHRSIQNPGIRGSQTDATSLINQYGSSQALAGEHVAITGTLKHGQRVAVQQLITAVGGICDSNLTRKTTLLVVGIPNPGAWAEGSSASKKLIKATKLREQGSPIQVLSEEEFFNRLLA